MFHPEVSCSLYVAAVAVVQAVWDAQEVVAVQNIRILHLHKAHCFPPSGTFFHNSNLYSHEIRTKLDLNSREEYSVDYKFMNSNHFYHKVEGVLGQIMDVSCKLNKHKQSQYFFSPIYIQEAVSVVAPEY